MKDFTQQAAEYLEEEVPADVQRFADINVDIAVQVGEYLKEKGWTQKDLADALGKSEAEISKWLSGMHNLTLKSITKMEVALGKEIILTIRKAEVKFREVELVTNS